MFSNASRHFIDAPETIAETSIGVHLMEYYNSRTLDILLERFQCTLFGPKLTFWVFSHHFGALKHLLGFTPHTLCLKHMFWVVSCHFVAAPDPLWKSVSGHQMNEFMPPKSFLVLSQRTCPVHYFSLKLMFWVVPCHFVAALETLQKLVSRHI